MRDYEEILKSMRICLNVDIDSNCLSECFGCAYIDHDHHIMDMVRDAADAVEELLTAVPHWISVEERLPPAYESVITANKNGDVRWNYLINVKYGTWSNGYHITHWMPLPEPPKEVE